jgi:hypothetical protein
MATLTRFSERTASRGRVDREGGAIRGVKLLGTKSANDREYTQAALRNAVKLYDGKKVYLDHPDRERMGTERKFRDWVGVIENPQYRSDGIYADIRLRKQSPLFAEVIEAAESFDGFFGMSHVAAGRSRLENGTEIVEEIGDVFSVDIVTDPATNAGLFESVDADDVEATPAYILGRLESLRELYGDVMPSGCKSHLRKAIAAAETLTGIKTDTAHDDFGASDDKLSWGESHRKASPVLESAPLVPRKYSHGELTSFASQLR